MIKIRLGNMQDVATLQRLNDEIFVDNSRYDTDLDRNWAHGDAGQKYFTELVSRTDKLCLLVEDDNKNIGYLGAGPKEFDYRMSRYVEIENMGVVPEYRGQGIGKMLMEKCTEWAKAKGYQKLFVNSYIANKGAADFYRKNGFVDIDISLEKSL